MRGKILKFYIDSALKVFSAEDKATGLSMNQLIAQDMSTGFGNHKV